MTFKPNCLDSLRRELKNLGLHLFVKHYDAEIVGTIRQANGFVVNQLPKSNAAKISHLNRFEEALAICRRYKGNTIGGKVLKL